jgi:formamidopyrimidine-DNA glycosylase
MEMESPPHPLCHFGMAGWFKIKGIETAYYKPTKAVPAEWPPKYWKFALTTLEEPGKPVTEAAYVDFRRFGRVRLIDCPAKDLRNTTPLKENGPDPVIDKDIFTVDWLADKCATKRVPIKALLLNQANISGIGNWVGYVSLAWPSFTTAHHYSSTTNVACL